MLALDGSGELDEGSREVLTQAGIDATNKVALLKIYGQYQRSVESESDADLETEANTVRDSDVALAKARKAYVYAQQDSSGKLLHRSDREAKVKEAEQQYFDCFSDYLMDVLQISPENALSSGYLKQIITKISLHQAGETTLSREDLLGTYGHIIVDAVAREQFYREESRRDFTKEKPTRMVDRIRQNKVMRGIAIGVGVLGAAAVTAKNYLPEQVKPIAEAIDGVFPFLGAYLSCRTTLDKISLMLLDRRESKKFKSLSEDIAQDKSATQEVLTSVYGEVEARPLGRQAGDTVETNMSRLEGVQDDLDQDLRRNSPLHPQYSAESAIRISRQMLTEYPDLSQELASNPQKATADIALGLLKKDITAERTRADKLGRIRLINKFVGLGVGLFADTIYNSVKGIKSDAEKIAKFAGVTDLRLS